MSYVGTEFFVKQRRVRLHGLLYIDGGWQWLVLDIDQVERVACGVRIVRDHRGNGVSVESDLALRQRTANAHALGDMPEGSSDHDITNLAAQIFGGVDLDHAWKCLCGISVKADDARVTIGAAQNRHVIHAEQLDIVNIGRLTSDQAGVFTPLDRRAN